MEAAERVRRLADWGLHVVCESEALERHIEDLSERRITAISHGSELLVSSAGMQNKRHFECGVCRQLGRLPDPRHHAALVMLDRRKSIQAPWASPTVFHQA
jgi:hypothetical protein